MEAMRRLALLLAVVSLCSLAGASSASAARFRPRGTPAACPLRLGGRAARPLRQGEGRIGLEVQRYRKLGRGKRRGALFASPVARGSRARSPTPRTPCRCSPALRSRELVVYDQRGTGYSSLLRCPSLERADLLERGKEAADCAKRVGEKRRFFTTRDTVEDIEAVRKAIKVDKISPYGVSYGTHVAPAYAATYPDHVERLVLDSTLEVSRPDLLYFDIYRATSRVLRTLCRGAPAAA